MVALAFFVFIALAARSLTVTRKAMNEMVRTQLDRLHILIGLENEPYIVMKVHPVNQYSLSEMQSI